MAKKTVLLLSIFILPITLEGSDRFSPRQCEEITIPMCKGIGYNETYMPNQFNHDNQEEAGLEVHQFWPLVEIQCSADLQFFLCSIYTPICVDNYQKNLPACRSVCERAKSGCAPLMQQYGFVWPERMRCEDLPEYGDSENLCMDFNSSSTQTTEKPLVSLPPSLPGKPDAPSKPGGIASDLFPDFDLKNLNKEFPDILNIDGLSNAISRVPTCNKKCACWSPLLYLEKESRYYNEVSTAGISNCAMGCHGAYFTDEARKFAVFWIGSWSILCCVSTLLTVITFFIDMQRFEYPERPIIFLSGCYLMVSIGYIIRLIIGHEAVACDGELIRYETTGPAVCTTVFLLVYFFGMASSIWWVILTFTWFLAAGLKWGQEAISSYSQYFHLIAWLVPSIKAIAIIATNNIDGDHVAGICYVGNQNMTNLRGFVLGPLILYLLLGTSFLVAGFVSLFRIRDAIRQQGHPRTEKLEKLMIRIGIFSVLYTVPATIVIACHFYEQHYRAEWDRTITCPCDNSSAKPEYSVYMLKYFMCLAVGITSGFWVWSGKTLTSWRNISPKCACCRTAADKNKYATVTYTTTTMLAPSSAPLASNKGSTYTVPSHTPSHV